MIDDFHRPRPSGLSPRAGNTISSTPSSNLPARSSSTAATHNRYEYYRSYTSLATRSSHGDSSRRELLDTIAKNSPIVQQKIRTGQSSQPDTTPISQATESRKQKTTSLNMHNTAVGLQLKTSMSRTRSPAIKIVAKYIFAALIILGISQLDLPLIDRACLSYGAAALILGIDSRLSLTGALIAIIYVPVLGALKYQVLSDAVATAAFYLLLSGVITMTAENIALTRKITSRKKFGNAFNFYHRDSKKVISNTIHEKERSYQQQTA